MRPQIDYWATASPRLRVAGRRTVLSHRVLLPRLLPNTKYDYEIRPVVEGSAAITGEFLTDTLPTELADVQFTAEGQPTTPLTMLSLRDPRAVVFVTGEGAIIWYWLTEHVVQATKKMPKKNL